MLGIESALVDPALTFLSLFFNVFLLSALCAFYAWMRSFMRAAGADHTELAALRVQRDQLVAEKEHAESYLRDHAEDLRSCEETAARRAALETELAEAHQACAQLEADLEEKRKEGGDLQLTVAALRDERQTREEELRSLESQLENRRRETAEVEQKLDALRHQATEAKERLNEERRQLTAKQTEYQGLVSESTKANAQLRALVAELTQHSETKVRLEEYLQRTHTAISAAQATLADLESQRDELRDIERRRNSALIDLDLSHGKKVTLEAECRRLDADIEKKSDELQRLEVELRQPRSQQSDADRDEDYASLLSHPDCLKSDRFARTRSDEQEQAVLDSVRRRLKEHALVFPDRIIHAFHTCLKVSDIASLTVLAGVSGTGKTLLPMEYARAMGMYSLVVSVQPRWDSPQDMLGFYNLVEQRYEATELVQALVAMDPYNFPDAAKEKDSLLLVLLDEMNLARVEYYFSEFLSKLELRRQVRDEGSKSDRSHAEVVIDAGRGNGSSFKSGSKRLWISSNILFVGTMNEDESTQTLSDKVLDRANVIRFGAPSSRATVKPTGAGQSSERLPASVWRRWRRDHARQPEAESQVPIWCRRLNEKLEIAGRPIGYRVQDSILAYVRNYPTDDWRIAFTDQLEYKILPKLRGLGSRDEGLTEVLETVNEILTDCQDERFIGALETARSRAETSGTFGWHGVSRGE